MLRITIDKIGNTNLFQVRANGKNSKKTEMNRRVGLPSMIIMFKIAPLIVGRGTMAANEKSRTRNPAIICNIERSDLN
jgi:hypothetical protein